MVVAVGANQPRAQAASCRSSPNSRRSIGQRCKMFPAWSCCWPLFAALGAFLLRKLLRAGREAEPDRRRADRRHGRRQDGRPLARGRRPAVAEGAQQHQGADRRSGAVAPRPEYVVRPAGHREAEGGRFVGGNRHLRGNRRRQAYRGGACDTGRRSGAPPSRRAHAAGRYARRARAVPGRLRAQSERCREPARACRGAVQARRHPQS